MYGCFCYRVHRIIVTRHLGAGQVTGSKLSNYRIIRQNDTTNTTETTAKILTGWGVIPVSTAAAQFDETITFETAFTNRPVVVASPAGDNNTNPGTGTGGNVIEANLTFKLYDVSTTSFKVKIMKPNSGNYGGNGFAWYHWIAIGN